MAKQRAGQSSRIPPQQRASGNALTRGYSAAEQCVTDYPTSAVGVAFGAGLGLGLAVGLALKSAINQRRSSHRRLSERLGRQVLEAVSSVLPESLASRMRS
jgi:hypothetical protein